MRILILGGDGYLGWPTAMLLAAKGHEVRVIDNYLRRDLASTTSSEALIDNPSLTERVDIFEDITGFKIRCDITNCTKLDGFMFEIFRDFQPEAVIHYAEQSSAPYSMIGYKEAILTFDNNLNATLNLIWAVIKYVPDCHIIKLGTLGEYGTPNIDIEEGWLEIEHKGRKDTFLYPRQGGSLYHTTKIQDTDMLWFYVRNNGLRVTDLMQGPVYGLSTDETELDNRLLPNFHYDAIFGTVINRFLVQAVAGHPLTVYGSGDQTRGYLNLRDTLQCIKLAITTPPEPGEMRILNQFTEVFTVNELAERVKSAGRIWGLDVKIEAIDNPRKEAEEHYYNPAHSGLLDLGLEPHYMTDEVLGEMLEKIMQYKDQIDVAKILPKVRW